MFYRYVAYTGRGGCSNGVEHGLLTLIPLIFGQPLTESERAEFDDAVLMFSNLPAPNDVYEKYSGSVEGMVYASGRKEIPRRLFCTFPLGEQIPYTVWL